MRPITRFVLLSIAGLFSSRPTALRAQSVDTALARRLGEFGRVWGGAKYFHPRVADGRIDWDSVAIGVIARIRAARTESEFVESVDAGLHTLHDPSTRVNRRLTESGGTSVRTEAIRRLPDSTLVIDLNPARGEALLPALSTAREQVARTPRVIFDLRRSYDAPTVSNSFLFSQFGIDASLTASPLAMPRQRQRTYSGFMPQIGVPNAGYWAGVLERPVDRAPIQRKAADGMIAFVINENSDVPSIAWALQAAGRGIIVSHGPPPDGAGGMFGSRSLPLSGDGSATIRMAELMMPGRGARVFADDVVAMADDPIAAAAAMLLAPSAAARTVTIDPESTMRPERGYAESSYPSFELRVLAAFRWWTAIQYFYPYKSLIGEDWNRTLPAFVASLGGARDSVEYGLAVAEMVARIRDSHGNTRNNRGLTAYVGAGRPGIRVRMIEGVPVVVQLAHDSIAASGIAIGDVVLSVDGEDVKVRYARLSRYVASSTPQSLDAGVVSRLLGGAIGSDALVAVRGQSGHTREVRLPRRAQADWPTLAASRTGPVYRMLETKIGYVDLERLAPNAVDSAFTALAGATTIVFDMRGYPRGVFNQLGFHLAPIAGVPAAIIRRLTPASIDATETAYSEFIHQAFGRGERYSGHLVMLIDERAVSQSEHTGLFLAASGATTFVGSPTAGANGDITSVLLPGGIEAYFTGQEVRWPDGRQLQRVGLQPHVRVLPTIKGTRSGKDEVLDRAVQFARTGR